MKRHNNATPMSELPENLTPVRAAHVFDEARLADYMKANVDGFRGADARAAVRGRAEQPDLPC